MRLVGRQSVVTNREADVCPHFAQLRQTFHAQLPKSRSAKRHSSPMPWVQPARIAACSRVRRKWSSDISMHEHSPDDLARRVTRRPCEILMRPVDHILQCPACGSRGGVRPEVRGLRGVRHQQSTLVVGHLRVQMLLVPRSDVAGRRVVLSAAWLFSHSERRARLLAETALTKSKLIQVIDSGTRG